MIIVASHLSKWMYTNDLTNYIIKTLRFVEKALRLGV